jgi:Holliday junction resolvase RusA-like endonuclease
MINLKILGIPQSKQSARFRIAGKGKKAFVQSYQKKSVKDNERNIAFDVKSQLPLGFEPFSKPVGVKVLFVFPPLASWSKKKLALLESGETIYKETKPDLTDNLMKGLFDAMNGVVFTDDSRICEVESKKIFGKVPRTEVTLFNLNK